MPSGDQQAPIVLVMGVLTPSSPVNVTVAERWPLQPVDEK
jgi:hypothetical protein